MICLLMACADSKPPQEVEKEQLPSQNNETTNSVSHPKPDAETPVKIYLGWNEMNAYLSSMMPTIKSTANAESEKAFARFYSEYNDARKRLDPEYVYNAAFYLTFVSSHGDSIQLLYDMYDVAEGREYWTEGQYYNYEKSTSVIRIEVPADYLDDLEFSALKEDYINLFRGKEKEALKEWFSLREYYNAYYRLSKAQRLALDSVQEVYREKHDNTQSNLNSAESINDLITLLKKHNEIGREEKNALKIVRPDVIISDEDYIEERRKALHDILSKSQIELTFVRVTFFINNQIQ